MCYKLHFPERNSGENEKLIEESEKLRMAISAVRVQECEKNFHESPPSENIEMKIVIKPNLDPETSNEQCCSILQGQEAEHLLKESCIRFPEYAGKEKDNNRELITTIKELIMLNLESNRYLRLLSITKMTEMSDPAVEAGSDMKLIATTLNRIYGIIFTIINMASLCWMGYGIAFQEEHLNNVN